MKKAAMFVLAIVFLLGTTAVIAKAANGNKDFEVNKKEVKLFAKKPISGSDRKRGDLLEQTNIKGAKTATPAPPTTDPTAGGVTGVLGVLPNGGQKYAIVIGLSNYPGTSESATDEILPDLCKIQVPDNDPSVYARTDGTYATLNDEIKANCKDEDSVTMEKTLIEKYGFAKENILRVSDSKATFSAIEEKVMDLVGGTDSKGISHEETLKPEDELVFFFSGHDAMTTTDMDDDGEADDGGIVVYDENYNEALYKNLGSKYVVGEGNAAVTYDNYKTYYDSTGYNDNAYIWDGQLRAWFENAKTSRIFFAFDTCNAAEMDDLAWTDALRMVKADGRVLAFSSGKNQSSYTYYLGGEINSGNVHDGEGLFSHYFVKRAMYEGLADGSNPLNKRSTIPKKYDGQVAVEEAFSYAYPLVRAGSSYRQTPVLEDAFTNDLLLGYPSVQ